ncbi:MAG: DMT family transporter [Legionellaceae bacterium]
MKTSFKGLLFLVLAQIMVGISIVCSKQIVTSMSILLLLFIRFTLASLILLPVHWISSKNNKNKHKPKVHLVKKDWLFIFLQALFAGVFFNLLMMIGLRTTDAHVAGIITSALPAMIAIMAFIFLNEKITYKKSLCIVFATLGLLTLAFDKFSVINTHHAWLGDLLILIALLPEAGYYILCKIHPIRCPIFLTPSLFNGINAMILLPLVFFLYTSPRIIIDATELNGLILAILGLTSALFYVFWFLGCEQVDGVMTSLSTAVMPVSTVILAWALLGEDLSLMTLSGMLLIVLSVIFYARD